MYLVYATLAMWLTMTSRLLGSVPASQFINMESMSVIQVKKEENI